VEAGNIKDVGDAIKVKPGLGMPAPEQQQAQPVTGNLVFFQKGVQLMVRNAFTLTIYRHFISPFLPLFTTGHHY
jgi:hypothetical protein